MAAGKHEEMVNKMTLDPGARYCAQQIDLQEARIKTLEDKVAECCKPATLKGNTPETEAKPEAGAEPAAAKTKPFPEAEAESDEKSVEAKPHGRSKKK